MQFLDDDNTLYLCVDNEVTLITSQGKKITSELQDEKGISCTLMKDTLLVLTDSGNLVRLNASTGEKIGEIQLEIYSSFFSKLSSQYHPDLIRWVPVDDKTLFLDLFNAGNLIQTDQWQVVAFIPECVGYVPQQNQFNARAERTIRNILK
jgi:hypothetical protein